MRRVARSSRSATPSATASWCASACGSTLLGPRARRCAEIFALTVTALFVAYMLWAVEPLRLRELEVQRSGAGPDQGADLDPADELRCVGVLIFFVAVLDELVTVLRRREAGLSARRRSAPRGRRFFGDASDDPARIAGVILLALLLAAARRAASGSRSRSPRWRWFGLQFFTSTPPDVNLFQSFWGSSASWTLAALPLFVWMGEILFRTKLSEEMFEGLAPWLGWLPGRLMHVNILGCGIFGTVSGSSAATCATIAKVALPELKRRGYDEKTCLGSLAAAGTLGILIPPSIIMVVYAVAAEVSIIKVFLAGFMPGLRADGAVLRLHHRLGAAATRRRRRASDDA